MRIPHPIWRLRRRAASALDRRVEAQLARMVQLGDQLTDHERGSLGRAQHILAELAAVQQELRSMRAELSDMRDRFSPVLRAIVTEESANRRLLEQVRAEQDYAVPFDHPDPLVTVCIPTYDRVEMLTERALPSILGQSYGNLEVIVVGDAAPPHVGEAVEAVGDERLRFVNLTHRHAVIDAERHWMVGCVLCRNAGYELAKGHWIVDFDDDDAMRPEAIESTLTKAREDRLEAVYGKLVAHFADGGTEVVGRFPPTIHQFGWQGAVVHRGLRFFGREHVAAWFGHPNDWFRAETMMRAGVRFGMVDDVLYDYYPARSWEKPIPVPENAFIEEHGW